MLNKLNVRKIIISDDARTDCTNQQPPQRGGAVADPVKVGTKWLLAFPKVPGTPGTLLYFLAMLPLERPQKGSSQLLQNRSPVFSISSLLPFSCPSSSPHSSSSIVSSNVYPNPGPIFPCSVSRFNRIFDSISISIYFLN